MRKIWIPVALVAVAALAFALWAKRDEREWTTDSPAALAAFERGLEEQMKYYTADAAEEFRRALELDPNFAVAKIRLLDTGGMEKGDRQTRDQLIAELRNTDRSRLTERERFLLDVALANFDDDFARREKVLQGYLEQHPRDPWALMIAATDAWHRQDWEPAEELYGRLLEVDPNWVMARNNLGYMAMAQGRFREAEEQFRTYRYAAPDQANPHDSLGELLVVLGRYDEARSELEEALAVRPDFCASYENLLRLAVLERRPDDLAPLAERVRENCDPRMGVMFTCSVDAGRAFLGENLEMDWDGPECRDVYRQPDPLFHSLALAGGRRDIADGMEEEMRARVAKYGEHDSRGAKNAKAILGLLAGQRLIHDGDPAAAIPHLREVDTDATWWGSGGNAILKLIARAELARALRETGQEKEAREVEARIAEVNPDFVARFADFVPGARQPAG